MEAGIIDNYSGDEFGGPYTSYYQFSSFGKDLIAGILSSVEVTPFLEQKEKLHEPRTSDLRECEMQKQSKYVSIEEILGTLRGGFKESEEPSVFYPILSKTTKDKMDQGNISWSSREMKINIRSVKTNE